MVNLIFSEETDEIGCVWRWKRLPRLMLRLMAPKNPEPDKENGLDFSRGSISVSVDVYMIPALKTISAISQVKPWMELNPAIALKEL